MADEEFEGFSNWETWRASVWLDVEKNNDHWLGAARSQWRQATRARQVQKGGSTIKEVARAALAEQLEEEIRGEERGDYFDMCCEFIDQAMSKVNWEQLADIFLAKLADNQNAPQPTPVGNVLVAGASHESETTGGVCSPARKK